MKKRVLFAACFILAAALAITVFPVLPKNETVAVNSTYAFGLFNALNGADSNPTAESSTNSLGAVLSEIGDNSNDGAGALFGDMFSNILGNEEIIGDIGNAFGGLLEGLGNLGGNGSGGNQQTPSVTYEINTIVPMVTVSESQTQAPETTEPTTEETTEPSTEAVTYDFSNGDNPFKKPADALADDAEGDDVKWLQWIFVYTNYGLEEADINGKLDEKTVSLIKKLQTERGLNADGKVTKELIDKAELLYMETKLGAGNTGQYIEPSATVGVPDDNTEEQENAKSAKIRTLIIIIAAIWLVVVAGVIAFFVIRKKKLAKEVAELDKETAAAENKDSSEAKPETKAETKPGEIGGISDLFAEANEDSGKKKKR